MRQESESSVAQYPRGMAADGLKSVFLMLSFPRNLLALEARGKSALEADACASILASALLCNTTLGWVVEVWPIRPRPEDARRLLAHPVIEAVVARYEGQMSIFSVGASGAGISLVFASHAMANAARTSLLTNPTLDPALFIAAFSSVYSPRYLPSNLRARLENQNNRRPAAILTAYASRTDPNARDELLQAFQHATETTPRDRFLSLMIDDCSKNSTNQLMTCEPLHQIIEDLATSPILHSNSQQPTT